METLKVRLAAHLSAEEFAKLDFDVANNPSRWWQDLLEALAQQGISDQTRILRWILGTESVPNHLRTIVESAYRSALDANLSPIVDPATRLDHISKYQEYISSFGKKVVVVAHSQGNYFANQAFPALSAQERESFGIVAVASPDTFVAKQVNGVNHVTLFGDFIIAPLQLARAGLSQDALLPNTTNLSVSTIGNAFGHEFVDSYLKAGSSSENKIANHVKETVRALIDPDCHTPPLPRYTVSELPNGFVSMRDVNNAGQVLGYRVESRQLQLAIYQAGIFTNIGTPDLSGLALNNLGEVVGIGTFSNNGSNYRSFLYSDGMITDLTTRLVELAGGGPERNLDAWDINDAGHIVGGAYQGATSFRAYFYDGTSIRFLGHLASGICCGSGYSRALAISENSDYIVGESASTLAPRIVHAFLYRDGVMTDLGTLGGAPHSTAAAVNNAGTVVGSTKNEFFFHVSAFMYRDGVMTDLGTLGGPTSVPEDLNEHDQIVGSSRVSNDSPTSHAFIYEQGVMKDLNDLIAPDSGWLLVEARGINDRGQIVGVGSRNGGPFGAAVLLTPLSSE